jgi:hypothetical protein
VRVPQAVRQDPHPNPLPGGEGTGQASPHPNPLPGGEGTRVSVDSPPFRTASPGVPAVWWVVGGLVTVGLIAALGWAILGRGLTTPQPTPQGKVIGLPSPTPLPTATPLARVRPGDPLLVPRASRPPVIDGGILGEWGGSGYPVAYGVAGGENLSGATDLSASLWFAWDDRQFYVASVVLDDMFSQPSKGETLWRGDSVEIQWDVDLPGDFDSNDFNADDWHIGLSPGNFADTPPEAIVWAPRVLGGGATGIQVAAQRISSGDGRQGYSIEAAIPWQLLGVVPRGNQTFGFTFCASDNDQPAPAQQSLLCTNGSREWHKPLTFSTMILQP